MSPVPAKFDKSQIVPLPAGVPHQFDKSLIQPVEQTRQENSPNDIPPTDTTPKEGFWSSAAAPLINAITGAWHTATDMPQGTLEKILSLQPGILPAYRALVSPAIEQGKQAVSEFKQANEQTPWYSMNPSPGAVEHRELALGHALATTVPILGPWAAQVGEKEGEQIGNKDYSGAAGTAFGNAALALVPKGGGKVKEVVPDTFQRGLRRLVGSGPGVANKLVREATEQNRVVDLHNADKIADAQQKHTEAVAKAAAEHKAELLRLRQKYAQDTRDAAEKARTGTAADREQYQARQLAAKQSYDQSVRKALAKHADAVSEANRANAEAQRQYNQNIGKVAQQNRAATAAERAKAAQDAHLQVRGSQLITGLQQLDKALRARAGTMFDAVRDKVAQAKQPPLPGTDLGTAARAALTKISGSSDVPKPFKDILGKYPESQPAAIEYQGAQIPQGHPLYDVLAKNGATGAPPVTFADLQGYYSDTAAERAKGTLAPDVYLATKELHNAIGDMMQKMANAAGAGKEFWDSRVFYRNYMDTFHEPTGPSGSGSPIAQALLAKDPLVAVDKFADDAGDRGIAYLRRYSDNLANLAQDARQTAQTNVSVPERKSVAEIKTPKTTPVPTGPSLPLPPIMEPAPAPRAAALPLPPVLPEPEAVPFKQPKLTPKQTIAAEDLQRANEAAVRARASGLGRHLFWWTGVWPAFRMLSEITKGEAVSPKSLALMPAAGAAGLGIEELLSHPPVMDFLTRATRQQIAQIPPDLRGAMPDIVAAAKAKGVKVSPILALYAATIQRNQNQANQPAVEQSVLPSEVIQ